MFFQNYFLCSRISKSYWTNSLSGLSFKKWMRESLATIYNIYRSGSTRWVQVRSWPNFNLKPFWWFESDLDSTWNVKYLIELTCSSWVSGRPSIFDIFRIFCWRQVNLKMTWKIRSTAFWFRLIQHDSFRSLLSKYRYLR